MEKIEKVDSANADFRKLVSELDRYLAVCDGEEHEFYDQYNHLDTIKNAVVLYINNEPVGCGAFKEFQPGIAEVKRMYVHPDYRNKGYASKILKTLEDWAQNSGYSRLILETGKRQIEAIYFYDRNGYAKIDNYGPYKNMENSICFEKLL